MFTGAHFLFYSKDPEGDGAFFRDVLELRSLDIGGGWLIFGMPATEAAIHPADRPFSQKHAGHDLLGAVLYLMCDDLDAAIASLKSRGVPCTDILTAEWGKSTSIPLPSGTYLGLYQPTHPTAISLNRK